MTQTISVTEAVALIKKGEAVLIDVREADEFKAEHIAYALSVPLSSLEDGFKTLDIPNNKIILFQCLKGSRGQMACERIQGMGACENTIINIEGGIEAWKDQGLPIILGTKSSTNISIMRQVQMIVGALVVLSILIGFTGVQLGFILAGAFGLALIFAGVTGWCGMARVLLKMPWNN